MLSCFQNLFESERRKDIHGVESLESKWAEIQARESSDMTRRFPSKLPRS